MDIECQIKWNRWRIMVSTPNDEDGNDVCTERSETSATVISN